MQGGPETAARRSLLAAVHDGCSLGAADLLRAAVCLVPGVIAPLVALGAWLGDSVELRDSLRRVAGLCLGHLVLGSVAWAAAARWIGVSAGGPGDAPLLRRAGAVVLLRGLRAVGFAVGGACLLIGAWPVSAAMRPALGAAVAGDGLRRALSADRWTALVRHPAALVAEAGFLFVEVAALACVFRGVAVEELPMLERALLVGVGELALFVVAGAGSAALARAVVDAPVDSAPAPAGWWRPFGGWPIAAGVVWAGLGTGGAALGVAVLAQTHEVEGEYEDALSWHRAVQGWPFAHDARLGVARCLRMLDRLDDADAALAEFRARASGRLLRGFADAEAGHLAAARGWSASVVEGREHFDRAAALLQAAARALPARHAERAAASLWAAVYGPTDDPAAAVDRFVTASRMVGDPAERAAAAYWLGLLLERLADAGAVQPATDGWAAAERAYGLIPAWAAHPDVVRDVPGRQAWCAWCRKDWATAQAHFQRATRSLPLDAAVAEHHRNYGAFLRDRVGQGQSIDPAADLHAAQAQLEPVRVPLPGESPDAARWVAPNLAWIALALDGDDAAAARVRALWAAPAPPEGPPRAELLREACVALTQLWDDTALPGAARCGALGAESGHELLRANDPSADADGYVRWSVGLWERSQGNYVHADALLGAAVAQRPADSEWGAAVRVDAAVCRFWRHGATGDPTAAREAAAWLTDALTGGALAADRHDEARWFLANLQGAGGDWAAGRVTIEALLAGAKPGTARGLSRLYEGALFYDRRLASGPAEGRDAAATRAIELVDRWRASAPEGDASRHELALVRAGAVAAAGRPADAADELRAAVAGLRTPDERAEWLERAADRARGLLDALEDLEGDAEAVARAAAEWYAELAARAVELGDPSRAGRMGYRTAWCRWQAGDPDGAVEAYRACLPRLHAPDDAGWRAWAADDLGDVLFEMAEWSMSPPPDAEAQRLHAESERNYAQAVDGIGDAQRPWSLAKRARALAALGRRADAEVARAAAQRAAAAANVSIPEVNAFYVAALEEVAARRSPALRAALRREAAARAAEWLAAAPADDPGRLRMWTRRVRCLARADDLEGAAAAVEAAIRERGAGSRDEREILARWRDAAGDARAETPSPAHDAAFRRAAERYEAALSAWLATGPDLPGHTRAWYALIHARLLRDLGRPEALDRMREVPALFPRQSRRHAETVAELCELLLAVADGDATQAAALVAEARTLLDRPLPIEAGAPDSPIAASLRRVRERLRDR